MQFLITGTVKNGLRTTSRSRASSAIVIAVKWDEQGVKNVRIASPGEEAQPFRTFQAKHYPASQRR